MEDENEVKTNGLAFTALDHAMSSIVDPKGQFIPFCITEDNDGKRNLQRFITEKIEQGHEQAKSHIEKNKNNIIRYAIAWDGYVTIESKKWEAILIESGDKYKDNGNLFCQRYEKTGILSKKTVAFGNPALIEIIKSRIK